IAQRKSSNGWSPAYLYKIISQPAVIGVATIEGHQISDYYPRVISDVDFFKVRDRRKLKLNSSGGPKSSDGNLFTDIAKCHACKAPMHKINKGNGPRSKNRGASYLVCSNAMRGRGCNYASWRYVDYELDVLSMLSGQVNWTDTGERIEAHSEEEATRL